MFIGFPVENNIEMDADEQLKNGLKEIWAKSADWDESPTSENGIFIVKYPSTNINQAFIGIKIKKPQNINKGYFLKSQKELQLYRDLLNCNEWDVIFEQIKTDLQLKKKIGLLDNWDQIPTLIPGLSFTKLPSDNDPSGIPIIAINPVNEFGKKMKKKNLFIMNREDLETCRDLFNNAKLDRLSRILDVVNDELSLEMRVAQSKIRGKYR